LEKVIRRDESFQAVSELANAADAKFSSQYCITLDMFLTNFYLNSDLTPPTNWDQECTTIFYLSIYSKIII